MKKAIVLILLLLILIAGGFIGYNKFNTTVNNEDVSFRVESGSGLKKIAENLKDENIISSSNFFLLYTKAKGLENNIQAGKFTISPNIEMDSLLETLQNPEPEFTAVTFPEGYTVYQMGELLAEKELVSLEEFLELVKFGIDENSDKNLEEVYYKLEGFLYPDTYHIPDGYTSRQIVEMEMDRLDEIFSGEYENRADELGLSKREVLTIASLIEREAAVDDERKAISGVIYNRLDIDMRLQIDATVIYAIKKGEGHIDRVLYKDLEYDSPYNTYKYIGLPPGPIGAPGEKSIEAALYPEEHEYFYYVFDGNRHVFSKTLREHEENVDKYIRN